MLMISPCVKICKLEGDHCIGCGRSLIQIKNWSNYTKKKRYNIMSKTVFDVLQEHEAFEFKEHLTQNPMDLGTFLRKYDEDVEMRFLVHENNVGDQHIRGHFVAVLKDQLFRIESTVKNVSELKRYITQCEQFVVNFLNRYEN